MLEAVCDFQTWTEVTVVPPSNGLIKWLNKAYYEEFFSLLQYLTA